MLHHLSKVLTKHGKRGDDVAAAVNFHLRIKYQHPDPIQAAIEAIRPVLKYQRFKMDKAYSTILLEPKAADGIAMRWIVGQANARSYTGGKPNLERGLIDEFDAILQGTSSLYQKRFQTHRNPN